MSKPRLGVGVGLCQWLHQHLQTIQSYGFHSALGNPKENWGLLHRWVLVFGYHWMGDIIKNDVSVMEKMKKMGFHGLWMGDKVGI